MAKKSIKKGIPRRDGSGQGQRKNKGRGGCEVPKEEGKNPWRIRNEKIDFIDFCENKGMSLQESILFLNFLKEQSHGIMRGLAKRTMLKASNGKLKNPLTFERVKTLYNNAELKYKEALRNARAARYKSPSADKRSPAFSNYLKQAAEAKAEMRTHLKNLRDFGKTI